MHIFIYIYQSVRQWSGRLGFNLEKFPDICADEGNEPGERFQSDIKELNSNTRDRGTNE